MEALETRLPGLVKDLMALAFTFLGSSVPPDTA